MVLCPLGTHPSAGSGASQCTDGSRHGSRSPASLAADMVKFTCLGAGYLCAPVNLPTLCPGHSWVPQRQLFLSGFALRVFRWVQSSAPSGANYSPFL